MDNLVTQASLKRRNLGLNLKNESYTHEELQEGYSYHFLDRVNVGAKFLSDLNVNIPSTFLKLLQYGQYIIEIPVV
jgi:hypothetical protein